MNPNGRVLFGLLVQAGFLALAVYLVVAADALPGASHVARVGLAAGVLAVGVLYGEISRVRADMARLIRALQQDLSAAKDDRMAIDVLVAALSAEDPEKRALAHKHLVRLTGRTFPPDAQPWLAWWKSARPTWGSAAPGASGTQGPGDGVGASDV
ncbi:MAG: hypothetical protein JNM10_13955 [Planctomycetia bacterium]|nr:hypothetical protein [Planctomycetia bacterium]